MKIAGIILIVLGLLLLLLGGIGIIFGSSSPTPEFDNTIQKVAFYIGYNLFNIMGVIFLVLGIVLRRKAIRSKAKRDLINSLPGSQVE